MHKIMDLIYRLLERPDLLVFQVLIFLAATLLFIGIVFLFNRRSQIADRLARLLPNTKPQAAKEESLLFDDESNHNGLSSKILKPIHKVIAPTDFSTRHKLKLRLIQAGLRSKMAYTNYLAAKVILFIILPLPYLAFSAYYSMNSTTITISVLLALAGFFLPNLVILQMSQKRQQNMSRALPDALDLMVICVEAGLGLDMTFKRVGDELRYLNSDLSDEFHLTNLEIMAGKSREESFNNMAARTGIPAVHNLMTILSQTSRLGTSMANALRVHADAMRIKRRQMAEERAAKSAVKLVLPLILFIFPAILIVLAGPAAIRIIKIILPVFSGG